MASTFNTDFLELFQSKALHMIVDAPWYVPNTVIRKDLHVPTFKEEKSTATALTTVLTLGHIQIT
jgi:hypothetical protein